MKQIKDKRYIMKKDPTYIGVFAIDGKATARDVKKYCRECLLLINEEGEDQVAGK